MSNTATQYAIRNKAGWYRSSGFMVEELCDAWFFKAISVARRKATELGIDRPKDGTPEIVELSVVESMVLDDEYEVERLKKAMNASKKRMVQREIRSCEWIIKQANDDNYSPIYKSAYNSSEYRIKKANEKMEIARKALLDIDNDELFNAVMKHDYL